MEWKRLQDMNCWDVTKVREWHDVWREAKEKGETHHLGRVFALRHEKNAELPEGHPNRKFKGRAVFQGNNVKDQAGQWAVFQDLSSNPATLESSRAVDAFGLLPGHSVHQSDAPMAYTQSELKVVPTWVRLPPDAWPDSWKGFRDPVCPLRLALYGHPDSGGFRESTVTQQSGKGDSCRSHRGSRVTFIQG